MDGKQAHEKILGKRKIKTTSRYQYTPIGKEKQKTKQTKLKISSAVEDAEQLKLIYSWWEGKTV